MNRWFFALVVLIGVATSACGGSSSETPFPLEPDSRYLAEGGPPSGSRYIVFTGAKKDGGADSAKSPDDEENPDLE